MLNAIKAELSFNRGQKLFKAGRIEESLAAYDRGIRLFPNTAGIRLHKAIALAAGQKYPEAISELQAAIELQPGNAAQHLWLGILYYDLERMTEAVEQFEAALAISGDNDLVACFRHLTLAASGIEIDHNCKLMLDKVEYTNTVFKSRLLLFTESYVLLNGPRARFLNDAMFYETYLKSDRTFPAARTGLLQNFKSACRRLHTRFFYAFAPTTRNATLHYKAGIELLEKGQLDQAETEIKRSVELRPDFEEARLLLIDLYLYRKNIEAAGMTIKSDNAYRDIAPVLYDGAPLAERKKDLGPHLSLVLALGIYHFYAGQFSKAIRLLEFIAGLSDNYYDDYYLGLCHLAQGDKRTAADRFQESMQKLNPAVASARLKEVLRLRQMS